MRRISAGHDVDFSRRTPRPDSPESNASGGLRPSSTPKPLESRKNDRDVYDLGFLFLSSYYRWYRTTKDPALREVLIEAGRTLAGRFKEKGQYVRSFVADNSLMIDIMMNVGIIFYAARETGDRRLRDVAIRHSLTTRRVLVRGDGSTAHEGIFDTDTGEFLKQTTHQGYRGDSCWSRGLTWALYGFTTCYEYSRDPHFLQTAQSCADYYISHAPADGIPPWDFNAPVREPYAARPLRRRPPYAPPACCACAGWSRPVEGALILVDRGADFDRAVPEAPGEIGQTSGKGSLKGGVYHVHKGLGVDESVERGEYFFCEALERVLFSSGVNNVCWKTSGRPYRDETFWLRIRGRYSRAEIA